VISRAETAQFQDYSKIGSGTNGEETGDDSEDEFVDAPEDMDQGDFQKSTAQASQTSDEWASGKGLSGKSEAERSSSMEEDEQDLVDEQEESEEVEDESPKSRKTNGKSAQRQEPKDDQHEHLDALKLRKKQKVQKSKPEPETISIASNTEDEGSDDDTEIESKNHDAHVEDGDEKMSGVDDDTHEQEIQVISDDESQPDEPVEDLFGDTFGAGKGKGKAKDSIENDSGSSFSGGPGKRYVSGTHKTTVIDSNSDDDRSSNPPTSTPPVPSNSRPAPPPPPRRRPDVKRDLSNILVRHEKFHTRAQLLIPRLPNHETLDWTRRYWIAVLIEGKRPKTNNTEKDFVWMKGNRFTTVATVFHSYAVAVMADPEDLALLLGFESVEMTDQMQELDYFNDRLVVFRALKVTGNEKEAAGMSLVPNIVPASEVINLDLD
jgi:hypothetical protein